MTCVEFPVSGITVNVHPGRQSLACTSERFRLVVNPDGRKLSHYKRWSRSYETTLDWTIDGIRIPVRTCTTGLALVGNRTEIPALGLSVRSAPLGVHVFQGDAAVCHTTILGRLVEDAKLSPEVALYVVGLALERLFITSTTLLPALVRQIELPTLGFEDQLIYSPALTEIYNLKTIWNRNSKWSMQRRQLR
jgi:hypothetical protein